jgi:hypothetical protein
MRHHHLMFRLTAAATIGAFLLGPLPVAAQAQQSEAGVGGDPPARVGRIARIVGAVSFHAADQSEWQTASLNYPVIPSNALWTQPGATAEIGVGPARLALDQATELAIDTLDDHTMAATVPQGELFLRLDAVLPGDVYQLNTPRGLVSISQPGRYEIAVGDATHPSRLTVVDGAATISGPDLSLNVTARQTAAITGGELNGSEPLQATVGPEVNDAFLTGFLAPISPPPRVLYTPPPVVAEMTGGEVLGQVGVWQQAPDYGEVWYPPVAADWVPYREGHWAYVEPWGWTWVDDASWGFAPFHYGRWAQIGPRWGWIPFERGYAPQPGVYARPAYSPALVTFIGLGAGVAVGAAIGASVGWIPLGPREPYYPPYRVSDAYLHRVNVASVPNVNNLRPASITNVTINNFANRRAVTVVPGSAMAGSQPIAARVQPQSQSFLAAARPVAAVPVRPTTATLGVTPAVARQLNLAGPAAARPAAPGPAIRTPAIDPGVRPVVPPAAEAPRLPAVQRPTTIPAVPRPPASTAPRVLETRPATSAAVPPRPDLSRPELPRTEPLRAQPPHAVAPVRAPEVARPAPVAPRPAR